MATPLSASQLANDIDSLANDAGQVSQSLSQITNALSLAEGVSGPWKAPMFLERMDQLKKIWHGNHTTVVSLLHTSKTLAREANDSLTTYVSDILISLKDENMSSTEKKAILGKYIDSLKSYGDREVMISQGFVDIYMQLPSFANDAKSTLSDEFLEEVITRKGNVLQDMKKALDQRKIWHNQVLTSH